MAHQINIAAILQPQRPLRHQQRHFNSQTIETVMVRRQGIPVAHNIIDVADGDTPLLPLVDPHPIIVQRRNPRHDKGQTDHRRQPRKRNPAPAANAGYKLKERHHSGIILPPARQIHRPDFPLARRILPGADPPDFVPRQPNLRQAFPALVRPVFAEIET